MKNNWTEEQKKEINALLDELEGRYVNSWEGGHYGILEQFIKDKGLVPALEVGKWYKWADGFKGLYYLNEKKERNYICFGFRCTTWVEGGHFTLNTKSLKLASEDEVRKAMIKEARKYRGATIVNMYSADHSTVGEEFSLEFNFKENKLIARNSNYRTIIDLFTNGKWATIVPTPTEMTIAQLEEKHGYTNLKIVK